MPDKLNLSDHVAELARVSAITQVVGAGRNFTAPDPALVTKTIKNWWNVPLPQPAPAPPPPPRLPSLNLDTGYIAFDNGVPVGGSAHLDIMPDGAFSFSGHFHDSGLPSYDVSFVFAVATQDAAGNHFAYTWPVTGRTHGTFEAGSRDFPWDVSQQYQAIADNWQNISNAYRWQWNAAASADIGQLITLSIGTHSCGRGHSRRINSHI